jgi:hypothetical protein
MDTGEGRHWGEKAHVRAAAVWGREARGEAFNLPELLAGLRDPDPGAPDDPEMKELFELDQRDRDGSLLAEGSEGRDLVRRKRGMEKLRAGEVRSPRDYYYLAMVLQHGGLAEHYHLGFELSRRAAAAGHRPARWLAAAALDRWLMQTGLPQRYGTQYIGVGGRWALYRVDPATTDDERAAWDVPPLAEAQERAERMNRGDDA